MKNFSPKRIFYTTFSALAGTAFAFSAHAAAGDVVVDLAKGLATPQVAIVYVILIIRGISIFIANAISGFNQ